MSKKKFPPTDLCEAIQGSLIEEKGSNPRQGILENRNPGITTEGNLYKKGGRQQLGRERA